MVYIPTMHIKTPLDHQREYEQLLASQQARQVQQQQMQLAQMKQEAFMREQQQAQQQQQMIADMYAQAEKQKQDYAAAMAAQKASPVLQNAIGAMGGLGGVPAVPDLAGTMTPTPQVPKDAALQVADKLMALGQPKMAEQYRKMAQPGTDKQKQFAMFPAKVQEDILRTPAVAKEYFPHVNWDAIYAGAGPDLKNVSGKLRDFYAINKRMPSSMEELYPKKRPTVVSVGGGSTKDPAQIALKKYEMEEYIKLWGESPYDSPEARDRYLERTKKQKPYQTKSVTGRDGRMWEKIFDPAQGKSVLVPLEDPETGQQFTQITFEEKEKLKFDNDIKKLNLTYAQKQKFFDHQDKLIGMRQERLAMFKHNLNLKEKQAVWARDDRLRAETEKRERDKEIKALKAAATKAKNTATEKALDWADSTRKEMNALAPVRAYKSIKVIVREIEAAAKAYRAAKKNPDKKKAFAAGILLVNKFSRLADDNAVREGEYARVGAGQGLTDRVRSMVSRWKNGGVDLTPEGAVEMENMAREMLRAQKAGYMRTVGQYRALAANRFPGQPRVLSQLLGTEETYDNTLKNKGLTK